jgi:hypothetical protein
VTPTRTAASTTRRPLVLVAMAAAAALALGALLSSPAAAFVNETPDDETTEESAPQEVADEDASDERQAPSGDGFVGDGSEEPEEPPVGGVDAGLGGGAADGGLGVPHAAAVSLLGLALAGHAANARRGSSVRR